jgi:CRISPR-associated endoribonuclease Cas6
VPSRWSVTLPGVSTAEVKLEYLHAVVCQWFDDSADAHRAPAKPYTVSPARAMPGGATIELGLLDDSLPDRLRAVAAPGTRIRLGSTWSTITHPPRQIEAMPWTGCTPSGQGAWCLKFLTPTTFRRGNAFTPAPTLPAILGSLRHSWQRFAPSTVPESRLRGNPT